VGGPPRRPSLSPCPRHLRETSLSCKTIKNVRPRGENPGQSLYSALCLEGREFERQRRKRPEALQALSCILESTEKRLRTDAAMTLRSYLTHTLTLLPCAGERPGEVVL
jgi:hypothetical protein